MDGGGRGGGSDKRKMTKLIRRRGAGGFRRLLAEEEKMRAFFLFVDGESMRATGRGHRHDSIFTVDQTIYDIINQKQND